MNEKSIIQTNILPQTLLLAQNTPPPAAPDGQVLNFDATPNIEVKPSTAAPPPNSHYIGHTSGVSVFVSLLAVFLSWKISKKLRRTSKHFIEQKLPSAWHGLGMG